MVDKEVPRKTNVTEIEFDDCGAYEIKEVSDLNVLDRISGGRGGIPWGADIDINFCWGSNSGCGSEPTPPRPKKPSGGEEGDDNSDEE